MLNDPNTRLDTFTSLVLENFKYLDATGKRAGFFVASAFMNPALTQNIEKAAKSFRESIESIDLTKINTSANTLDVIYRSIKDAIKKVEGYRKNVRTGFIQSHFFATERRSFGSFEEKMVRAIDAVISKIEDINNMISSNIMIAKAGIGKIPPAGDIVKPNVEVETLKSKYLEDSKQEQIYWAKQSESFQALKNELTFAMSCPQTTRSSEIN